MMKRKKTEPTEKLTKEDKFIRVSKKNVKDAIIKWLSAEEHEEGAIAKIFMVIDNAKELEFDKKDLRIEISFADLLTAKKANEKRQKELQYVDDEDED